MRPGPGEPAAGPWRTVPVEALVRLISDDCRGREGRPWIVAVDGRSGSGKTTVAAIIHRAVPSSAIVHTDDVAWHHSFFGWTGLMIAGILEPLRRGNAVRYRPPGWIARGRPGAIEVLAGQDLVIVEGVGASRLELAPWIDRSVWVQSDIDEAERRGIERDGGTDKARSFWQEWAAAEIPFLQRDRPWERAALVVNGTPALPHDPTTEVVVAPALRVTGE